MECGIAREKVGGPRMLALWLDVGGQMALLGWQLKHEVESAVCRAVA